MTREQLDTIRARLDAATPGNWTAKHEAVTTDLGEWGLVAETLNDTDEQRAADARLIANAPTDLRALLDEVERLTADPLPAAAWVREVERAAFRRGAEAMRAAAVAVASKRADLPKHSDLDSAWCRSAECILDELRNLPLPEDK